ncbi:chorismate mutase [Rhodobium gokarnense]|uniref:chorismate mutase n=1 Tax=Rhodobium gokarnense TaxID=364296 RepID=A0ABT3HHJ4_9HYPH|nr:chorismate mutase [Rhodobium gokarnense]MCW2309879.1 chorismate mutase [Rhodobium gokarnense]
MSDDTRDTASATDRQANLARLRERIDTLDAEMHDLLIERSSIIDELIVTKQGDRKGAAFRPAREAAMMHRFAGRHRGTLPLITVEYLWREIISTFTYLQAPFRLHIPTDRRPNDLRDVARFYFGFNVPLLEVSDADAAIGAVATSENDLALVPLVDGEAPWWQALTQPDGPRIIARLPFFTSSDRPADLPAVVISNPLDDPTPPEWRCYVTAAGPEVLDALSGVDILATAPAGTLFALAADRDPKTFAADAGLPPLAAAGGFAAPLSIDGDPSQKKSQTE